MMSNVRNLLRVTILAVLASTGYAIHCYNCDSLFNSKCGQKFEAEVYNLFDCSRVVPPRYLSKYLTVRNATGCMTKVLEYSPGHQQILRSCYFGNVNNKEGCQSDRDLPPVKELACDICTKDNCNGSG